MEKKDGRSLSHATLEEMRIRAVQRVEAGESPEVVVKALGFSRPSIYEWLALYREGGLEDRFFSRHFGFWVLRFFSNAISPRGTP